MVLTSLDDDLAQDIVTINLEGKSALADHMVIATGRSQRHVGALADHLLRKLKESGRKNIRTEGQNTGDWVLVDAGDVVVHIFREEVRAFYSIEKMWATEAEAQAYKPDPARPAGLTPDPHAIGGLGGRANARHGRSAALSKLCQADQPKRSTNRL